MAQRTRTRTVVPNRFMRRGPFGPSFPLRFSSGNYAQPLIRDRYLWDDAGGVLYGPFGPNVLPTYLRGGKTFAQLEGEVISTVGKTEDFNPAGWAKTGVTVNVDVIAAPDSAKLADRITFAAGAGNEMDWNLSSATDNTDQTIVAFARTESGTKGFRLGFKKKDGSVVLSGDFTATTSWQRFDFTADIGAGATAPEAIVQNESGGAAGSIVLWGCYVCKDKSFPCAYYTNNTGAEETKIKDVFYWDAADVPPEMFSGSWKLDIVPFFDNTEIGGGGVNWISKLAAADGTFWDDINDTVEIWDGAKNAESQPLTYSRDDDLTIYERAVGGTVEIQGAATGNGLGPIFSPWDWSGTATFPLLNNVCWYGFFAEPEDDVLIRPRWTRQTAFGGYVGTFQCAVYANNRWVIAGDNGEIQTSDDGGVTWVKRTQAGAYAGSFTGAAYDGATIVLVGSGAEIQTSIDNGVTWIKQAAAGAYAGDFLCATYGGGQFLIGGTLGELETSPAGIVWTKQVPGAAYGNSVFEVTYHNGLYLFTGAGGTIQTSPGAVVWTPQVPAGGYAGNFWGCCAGKNFYQVMGDNAEIQISPNGIAWTKVPAVTGYASFFWTGTFGRQIFAIIGDGPEIECSQDSAEWEPENFAPGYAGFPADIAYGGNQFVMVGTGGEIQTSP